MKESGVTHEDKKRQNIHFYMDKALHEKLMLFIEAAGYAGKGDAIADLIAGRLEGIEKVIESAKNKYADRTRQQLDVRVECCTDGEDKKAWQWAINVAGGGYAQKTSTGT